MDGHPSHVPPDARSDRVERAGHPHLLRTYLLLSMLLGTGPVFVSCASPQIDRQDANRAPNVVLIISDDQGWHDYGFMGHPAIRTPNIDRLAEEGAVFRRGYVAAPLCRPSLLSLATGRYPHTHGVTGNDLSAQIAPHGSERERALVLALIERANRLPSLPRLLGQAGYMSHQSGKWWEGSFAQGGFTEGMTLGFPHPGGRHGDAGLAIGREGIEPIADFVDRATARGAPFLVWYAPFLPHRPHDPPARFLDRYGASGLSEPLARYYAMCEWLDETVGVVVKMLDERGLRQDTLIVFLADNGWIQDPREPGHAPRSKRTVYEAGVRTPIIFSWPGTIVPGDRPALVSSLDILPTLLEATGNGASPDLPGASLWSALRGDAPLPDRRIFGEGFTHDIADPDEPAASLVYRYLIDGRYKLILGRTVDDQDSWASPRREAHEPELFDLTLDPDETTNLATRHPEVVVRMRAAIEQWYPLGSEVEAPEGPPFASPSH